MTDWSPSDGGATLTWVRPKSMPYTFMAIFPCAIMYNFASLAQRIPIERVFVGVTKIVFFSLLVLILSQHVNVLKSRSRWSSSTYLSFDGPLKIWSMFSYDSNLRIRRDCPFTKNYLNLENRISPQLHLEPKSDPSELKWVQVSKS
jgi:hypothetical protein